MNILLINNQARPETSGIASHFENISTNLLSLGCSVMRVVASDPTFINKNIKIKFYFFIHEEKMAKKTALENKKRIESNYQNIENVLRGLDWTKIDFVIASNDIYLSLLKKHTSPDKMVAIIPSFLAFSKFYNPKGYATIVKRIKKNTQGVQIVVLSNKMGRMLSVLLGKNHKISVVPPGVHHARFSKKIISKKNHLLYVGRISKEKNIGALLTAVKKVTTPCSLTLVGTGGASEKIKAQAKKLGLEEKVIFTGRKENVEDYYAKANLFILPSTCEAFGLVILEAMSAGLPVIAFRPSKTILTASDEIISDGIDGFLVKNEQEMAEKIDFLLKNKKVLEKMSKKALERAQEFNWQNHVEKLLSLLKHN